ncbi:GAF domain-containing protein [Roseivirga echinicomitans]|uniref:GAF domain-containing protein n=1 Tax=Roseivirga echinicomitans TaxID=296218 RepID=A0A150XWZ9_9BACT|nr:GAF domain-containing protein [Roseivirga echinicomitans]KYG83281.1 GAF domain-containing protein [Roseivirga echinicomitans]
MAEELIISNDLSKAEKYETLIPQIEALVTGEPDQTANLANIASALKYGMGFFWVGFYLVKEDELVLGPFQGPIACTRIRKGKGVCGTSWETAKTIVVQNVDEFPGHIACSSASKSEIVLPAMKNGEVNLILDVDSDQFNDFDEVDQLHLEKLMQIIEGLI